MCLLDPPPARSAPPTATLNLCLCICVIPTVCLSDFVAMPYCDICEMPPFVSLQHPPTICLCDPATISVIHRCISLTPPHVLVTSSYPVRLLSTQ